MKNKSIKNCMIQSAQAEKLTQKLMKKMKEEPDKLFTILHDDVVEIKEGMIRKLSSSENVPYSELPFGFKYGPMIVERMMSDKQKGWVVIEVRPGIECTKKEWVQIYMTATGKIRVFKGSKELK